MAAEEVPVGAECTEKSDPEAAEVVYVTSAS